MKQLATLVSMIFFISSYGQENRTEKAIVHLKRFQIGLNISPDISYRTLKNNNGISSGNLLALRNANEIAKFGYTTGLNAVISINKSFDIETGIQYSNKGYQTKMKDVIFEQPNPNLPKKSKFIYNLHYIEIPLKANFIIGKKKIRFLTGAGLTTNLLIKESQTTILEYSDGKTDKDTRPTAYGYKKLNISPTISIGLDYKINNRTDLRVEPTFRYGILKTMDSPITEYLWNGGLNISYYFEL